MKVTIPGQVRLVWLLIAGFSLTPTLAVAEEDYGVTMRMVADEEALDNSFVQEMEIPESINELDDDQNWDELDANELSSEAWSREEDLSLQARESRDAFDTELPGEELLDAPTVEQPGLDTPELDLPGTDLPTDDLLDPGLDLLNNTGSTLDNTVNQ
ncbi:hypothetical protein [Marinobacter sp. F4218]|uniref:hypothetical protein n=1 Tax=Marinobacter sp. F4218 TaxID=2862868 RepID=UPI001C62E189|nr:hypothetical protein [Marinobacter sp. F4218]MBW7471996.1 hypothetical protein [Marinobacter sp. F4218]